MKYEKPVYNLKTIEKRVSFKLFQHEDNHNNKMFWNIQLLLLNIGTLKPLFSRNENI